MKALSKEVIPDSVVDTADIIKIAKRYRLDNYLRPIKGKDEIKSDIVSFCAGRPLVLDAACGVGESSQRLASLYKDCAVMGFDKSRSRVERKNEFKRRLPENAVIMQADMLDIWPAVHELERDGEIKIAKQFILYPNPWPKAKGLKKRWYANPIMPFIIQTRSEIELRSNWKRYLEDFLEVSRQTGEREGLISEIKPEDPLTPFERKYASSGQKLYKLVIGKKSEP